MTGLPSEIAAAAPTVDTAAQSRLWRGATAFGRSALDLLLPPRCTWCDVEQESFADDVLLCTPCRNSLVGNLVARCPRCGLAGTTQPAAPHCLQCGGRRLRFERVVTLGAYTGTLRECVLRLKHRGHEALALAAGGLLATTAADALASLGVEAILPVPMHWARRVLRRTNSPELLAAALARRMHIPVLHRVVQRARYTRRQGPMQRTERLRNIGGAFRVRDAAALSGRRLLIVDDVMTTGTTCDELARVALRAGAAAVCVAVLARADNPYGLARTAV